jgi:hypothetical protein
MKSTIFQVLLALYLMVVVLLVRRQINQVKEEEEDEEDRIVMVDKKGRTDIKIIDKVLNNENEVFK